MTNADEKGEELRKRFLEIIEILKEKYSGFAAVMAVLFGLNKSKEIARKAFYAGRIGMRDAVDMTMPWCDFDHYWENRK